MIKETKFLKSEKGRTFVEIDVSSADPYYDSQLLERDGKAQSIGDINFVLNRIMSYRIDSLTDEEYLLADQLVMIERIKDLYLKSPKTAWEKEQSLSYKPTEEFPSFVGTSLEIAIKDDLNSIESAKDKAELCESVYSFLLSIPTTFLLRGSVNVDWERQAQAFEALGRPDLKHILKTAILKKNSF